MKDLNKLIANVLLAGASSEGPQQLLAQVTERICTTMNWTCGQVFVKDDQLERFVYVPVGRFRMDDVQLGSSDPKERLLRGEVIAAQVQTAKQSIWLGPDEFARLISSPVSAHDRPIRSVVAMPLAHDGNVLAVFELFTSETELAPEILSTLDILGTSLGAIYHRQVAVLTASEHHVETQVLLDLITARVFYKDTHNRILRANKAAAESLGMTPLEIEGRTTEEMYPLHAEKFYSDDLEVIESGKPKLGIVDQIVDVSGRKRWIRTDKIPVCRADGTVSGVVVFSVDVTQDKNKQAQLIQDRRQLQTKIEQRTQSLRETESRLATLSRMAPGVLYQFLLAKDGTQTFPYMADSAYAIFGFDAQDFLNDVTVGFTRLHPDDAKLCQELISKSAATLSPFSFEGRFYKGTGEQIWIQARSVPEKQPNGDVLWNGVVTDITDLKRAQEQIRQLNEDLEHRVNILAAVNKELELLTHKLEVSYDQALEASRLKSEFVANISHEVRTPISAVIGMSELLMDTNLTEEQREFTRLVQESALSLLSIINDILDFSKMEAGKIDLELVEFNLTQLVEGCAELLSAAARERGLSLMTHIDPSLPRTLQGDPVRLRQVLLNLASNAIKFTEQGEVVITVGVLQDGEVEPKLRFDVRDTGIGLSEAARKLLFQPFVQGDGSTSRRYGGTGLGLSISKRLVELMGGEIGVDSVLGSGSTFWFVVPCVGQKIALDTSEISAKPIRALVSDPSSTCAGIVSSYLNHAGIACDIANNHEQALELLKQTAEHKPYNVALIGGADGDDFALDLVKRIHADESLRRPRLILLAHFDDRQRLDSVLEQGFDACLVRPLRQMQLVETVNRILSFPREGLVIDEKSKTAPTRMTEPPGPLTTDAPILVAEDNTVMQQLAVRRIRKMGLHATAVSNGLEVLEALKQHRYALILMDCQMPEMDGFEATAAIRRDEAAHGGHTPIIAMTAAAMVGDREHCLTSGMDDYLSKPVSHDQLREVLRKWLPPRTRGGGRESMSPEAVPAQLVAEQRAKASQGAVSKVVPERNGEHPLNLPQLEHLYGVEDMRELLGSFIKEASELRESIDRYCKERNAQDLAAQIHQLKGLASVMTAHIVAHSCQEFEKAVKDHDWDQTSSLYGRVCAELDIAVGYCHKVLESSNDTMH